ncbi:rhs element Vgr family protein [Acinetobacter baumannii 44327_8]|nr:rhs element Vgr family protein [Acinetobacter baumannii 1294217]EXB12005.1 rhs element Vgr family protein [Acinetobacter baumannii 1406750]EXB54761.1 rhs element Vgr family protein [Acinetobacter baumannii 1465485]EXB99435.1 rhs element Vgr family protein [Acinetobacter baumannii 400834]EXD10626.1 rhs element Vgr family protein [Acinetobacter baumannii 1289546]EXD11830.1 rhs element Vgr family protein [Acinetobacter baumannii 136706]EXD43537.1 rhs element Vgr family protein [Acinetobacter 
MQVAVDQVTDRGSFFRTTGIITGASQGQSDGALTLYKLAISDPTYLWHKRRNSRVFMNKSVKEISEILFQEWQGKSPLFASSLTLDLSGLKQTYDVRPFVMQLNESDYDFLTRLWRSEGISWLIDEAELTVASNMDNIQPQKLRLIDDNNQYQALTRRAIRYHRSSATEQFDSMTSLMADRSLQPTSIFVQRWQPDVLQQTDGAGSVQSKHQHSTNYDNQSLSLEEAWHFSPAWMQDLNGEDGATSASNQQLEKFNQNLSAYYDAQSKQFIAKTTVRDTQVGYWFELNEHPEIDQHESTDKEFLIIGKNYYNQNNLPKDLNQQIQTLVQQSDWQASNTDERQANQLILQRRYIPTTPAYNPQTHSPVAHPQRAKVVGPEGEEIYVDEWGRIKVRFLFTRSDDHSHDGGAGTNNNDTDSAWIDVLTPWAGEGYGARFLPRIGEIVVINFFNGDIDRPFVMGRVHEAQRHPTKFDNKGKLPDTKKLSGIRSKEVSGGGFGQLRFDDTPGQISTQLQSSHGASQLNLGKLSHPKDKAESEDRGEGFELRTDQWGALRAGQGLLVSTHKQDNAKGDHLDAEVAKKQLEGSQTNSKALSDIAKNQKTDEIESIEQLKDFASQIQQQIAKFEKALLLLSSPDGIALSSSEDIHISADAQINQIAGDSINISTQKNVIAHAQNRLSLFAAQSGLKAVAAQGKVEIQAQADALDVLSKLGITISSTDDKVIISSPKEVKITGGSSQITLNGSGIFPKTGGKFQVNAGQHLFMGGASANASAPELPKAKPMQGALELLRSYGGDNFFKQNSYKVIDSLGKQITGKLDGNGFAQVTGIAPGPAKVVFEKDNTSAWLQSSDFKRNYTWAEPVKSVQGLMKNALEAVGQNTMSQLQNNLLSTDKNSFKNLGKNTLDNLAGQTVAQIKNQVTNTALNTVSKQLNLNLSADQMKSLGQMATNPSQSLEMLKEQGGDFLSDQMTAKLFKTTNQESPIQQGDLDTFVRSKK